jgi:hypothetical protein
LEPEEEDESSKQKTGGEEVTESTEAGTLATEVEEESYSNHVLLDRLFKFL